MTSAGINTDDALNNIQETLTNVVGSLFSCPNTRKLTSITGIIPLSESKSAAIKQMHRKLQSTNTSSVDLGPHTVDTSTNCGTLQPSGDQKCEVISASIIVYTSDPDLLSSALNHTENEMNGENSSFVNQDLGILDLHFLESNRQTVTAKAISPASSDTISEPVLAGAITGSVLVLAIAFLLARLKKSTHRKVSEDFEEDDLSLFSKSDDLKNLYPEGPFSDEDLDGVLLPPGSRRNRSGRGRRARVLNEDDYYLSSPNMECIAAVEISGDKDTPEDEGFELQRQNELDVHKCSSATCQLCIRRKKTMFEPSFGSHSGSRIYHNENTVTF